jgi:hypothetical protein
MREDRMVPYRSCSAACLALALLACNESKPATASSAAPSAEVPPPTATAIPAAPLAGDVDLATLEKDLGCSGGKGAKQACRVLSVFAEAGVWTGETPSGDGRWVGTSYVVEKGQERAEQLVLRAQAVPTSQVGTGDLPIKVTMGPVPAEIQPTMGKLLEGLARGDRSPRKGKQAIDWLPTFSSPKDRRAAKTTGTSVRLISEDNVYLRKKSLHQLVMVKTQSDTTATPGDGVYAELWLAVW